MTKIMLVEDDNNLREIYEARLAAEGYEIVSAQDGEAALAMASKEHPDMIISDIMMPKISGFEMLDILRNTDSLKNVKIIMLTALGQIEDSARASSLGADRYLVKSQVTLEDIVKATHDLLDDPNDRPAAPVAPPAAPADEPDDEPVAEPVDEPAEETPAPIPAPEPAVAPAPAPEPVATPEPEAAPEAVPTEPEIPSGPITSTVAPEPPEEDVTPASEPATPEVTAPEPESTPEPVVASEPEPVSEPEPAQAPVETPVTVRSIPVRDYGADDSSAPAPESAIAPTYDSPTLHPISNLPVMPEPSDQSDAPDPAADGPAPDLSASIIPAPAPTDDTGADSTDPDDTSASEPAEDFTSPDNFNKFQAPPTVPAAEDAGMISDEEPQTTADEEASIKAKIDDFISQPAAPVEEAQPEAEPQEEPIAEPKNEPVEEPVAEPEAEEFDTISPPVISAPPDTEAPEPIPMPLPPTPPVPVSESDSQDELMASAANDLAAGIGADVAPDPENSPAGAAPPPPSATDDEPVPTVPSTGTKMRTIIPIASDPKPSLNQLLELEDAKASAQQAAGQQEAPAPRNVPNIDAYNPSAQPPAPRPDPTDPNSISL